MSQFRRVAETQQQDDLVTRTFLGSPSEVVDDPYANLRAAAPARRERIARNTVEASRGVSADYDAIDWSARNQPTIYENGHTLRQQSAADMSGNGIRRIDSGTDQGLNKREIDSIAFVTEADGKRIAESMFSPEYSIWMSEYADVAQVFEDAAENSGMYQKYDSKQQRAKRLSSWQDSKLTEYAPEIAYTRVSSRAPMITRSGMENLVASKFGQVDYDELDRQERARQASYMNKIEHSNSIKSNHILSDEERHSQWQENAGRRTASQQDHSSSWMNNFADKYDR